MHLDNYSYDDYDDVDGLGFSLRKKLKRAVRKTTKVARRVVKLPVKTLTRPKKILGMASRVSPFLKVMPRSLNKVMPLTSGITSKIGKVLSPPGMPAMQPAGGGLRRGFRRRLPPGYTPKKRKGTPIYNQRKMPWSPNTGIISKADAAARAASMGLPIPSMSPVFRPSAPPVININQTLPPSPPSMPGSAGGQYRSGIPGFREWLQDKAPQVYRGLQAKAPHILFADDSMDDDGDVMSAVESDAPESKSASGGWADDAMDVLKTLVPAIGQYKIMKMQVKRAEQGLPPIDTADIAPTAKIDLGDGAKKILYLGGGALLLMGAAKMFLPKLLR